MDLCDPTQTNWELVRNNWINGNLKDARKRLLSCTKKQLIGVMYEALTDEVCNDDKTSTLHLREILSSIIIHRGV